MRFSARIPLQLIRGDGRSPSRGAPRNCHGTIAFASPDCVPFSWSVIDCVDAETSSTQSVALLLLKAAVAAAVGRLEVCHHPV
jgi:hypothetical protein